MPSNTRSIRFVAIALRSAAPLLLSDGSYAYYDLDVPRTIANRHTNHT
jgi:hypothetical protein